MEFALTIWLGLLVVTAAPVFVLARVTRPRDTGPTPEPPPLLAHALAPGRRMPAVASLSEAPDDDRRYAGEVGIAADRAAVSAARHREEWRQAERVAEAARLACDAAEAALDRVLAAAAFPLPASEPTPAEFAARERYLRRTAFEAHRRGELTTDQLVDAWSHRGGFDSRRHPVEQDIHLRRVVRDRRLAAYREAAAVEREAWERAELAADASRSLRTEAVRAALRAERVRRPDRVNRPARGAAPAALALR